MIFDVASLSLHVSVLNKHVEWELKDLDTSDVENPLDMLHDGNRII